MAGNTIDDRQASMLSAVFGDAKDITDQLKATETMSIMEESGQLGQHALDDFPETAQEILGDGYHPGWLATLDKAYASNTGDDLDRYPTQLIDEDMQTIHAISLGSGLLEALENWWGITGNDPQTRAEGLIRAWRDAGTQGYEQPGRTLAPSAAALVTTDGQPASQTDLPAVLLFSTASSDGRDVRWPLLGLDVNDRNGVRAFLQSIIDPAITRETHISDEIQRQRGRGTETPDLGRAFDEVADSIPGSDRARFLTAAAAGLLVAETGNEADQRRTFDKRYDSKEFDSMAILCATAMSRSAALEGTDVPTDRLVAYARQHLPERLDAITAGKAERFLAEGETRDARKYIASLGRWIDDNREAIDSNLQPSAGFDQAGIVKDSIMNYAGPDETPLTSSAAALLDDFDATSAACRIADHLSAPDGKEWLRKITDTDHTPERDSVPQIGGLADRIVIPAERDKMMLQACYPDRDILHDQHAYEIAAAESLRDPGSRLDGPSMAAAATVLYRLYKETTGRSKKAQEIRGQALASISYLQWMASDPDLKQDMLDCASRAKDTSLAELIIKSTDMGIRPRHQKVEGSEQLSLDAIRDRYERTKGQREENQPEQDAPTR